MLSIFFYAKIYSRSCTNPFVWCAYLNIKHYRNYNIINKSFLIRIINCTAVKIIFYFVHQSFFNRIRVNIVNLLLNNLITPTLYWFVIMSTKLIVFHIRTFLCFFLKKIQQKFSPAFF